MPDPAADLRDELSLDQALRDGLRALPVPPVGPDFDARVLRALRAPTPWWRHWWEPARPLLLGASCSLGVTLVLLHWTLAAPLTAPRPQILGESERPVAAAPPHAPSLDALLDRPGLRAGSLAAAWGNPLAPNPGGTGGNMPPPDRRSGPPRHAQAGRRAGLVV